MTSIPRSPGDGTERETFFIAPGRRPSSCVSNTRGLRWSRRVFRASCFHRYGRTRSLAGGQAEAPAIHTAGTDRILDAPPAPKTEPSAALLQLPQPVEVDHPGVEEAGLVERRGLLVAVLLPLVLALLAVRVLRVVLRLLGVLAVPLLLLVAVARRVLVPLLLAVAGLGAVVGVLRLLRVLLLLVLRLRVAAVAVVAALLVAGVLRRVAVAGVHGGGLLGLLR